MEDEIERKFASLDESIKSATASQKQIVDL
jgi:hypothetical protein